MLDGGEIMRAMPLELVPVGGQPADIFHQGHAGEGEGSDHDHQFHESPKRPADEKSGEITSAEAGERRRDDVGHPACHTGEGGHAGSHNGCGFPGRFGRQGVACGRRCEQTEETHTHLSRE